ncbi:nucleoside monophosphate kinase [Chlamydiales bacterium]|nr:nucleoside monophosphate kinase [Chlamydiales bacterium]
MKSIHLSIFFLLAFFPLSSDVIEPQVKQIIILLGPPGSGKGTQADPLKTHSKLPHISTGNLFREYLQNASEKSELARTLKQHMTSGDLIPDRFIIEILKERVAENDAKKGYILDGFPRTLSQAQALDKMLTDQYKILAIYFDVPDDEIIKRIDGRISCSKCNAIYNRFFLSPS